MNKRKADAFLFDVYKLMLWRAYNKGYLPNRRAQFGRGDSPLIILLQNRDRGTLSHRRADA